MAKIVLSIAALLMLASAYFSFASKGKITELHANVQTANDQAASAQKSLTKTQGDLKAAQDQTAAANQKADAATAEASRARDEANAATQQVAKLKTDLEEANKRSLSPGPGTGPSVEAAQPGVPREEFEKVTTELKNVQNELAKAKDEAAAQKSRAADAESRAKAFEQDVQRHRTATMRPGIEGQVLAVNPSYGFVVLSLGDRQGAVTNAEMIVVRNGERIGRVRISTVEPSSSIADIISNSLARGVRIQPGDRVVFVPAGGG